MANTIIEESTFKTIKGYGAYIDIFPFDYVPENAFKRTIYCRYTRLIEKLIQHSARVKPTLSKSAVNGLLKGVAFFMTRPINSHKLALYLDRLMARKQKSSIGGVSWDVGTLFNTSDYEDLVELDFEGHRFYGPRNWDRVLRDGYGDYMKLPPETERINKHHICCHIINTTVR